MGFSNILHVAAKSSNSNTISTSSSFDTTGSDLLIVMTTVFNSAPALTDAYSNTWTSLTGQGCITSLIKAQLFYCNPPSNKVGANHTFTLTGSTVYPALCVLAVTGSAASPFDVENGASNITVGSTAQGGTVTPSVDNEIVISGYVCGTPSTTYSINQGFTISDQLAYTSGQADGCALAYLIQTTATAQNPTWTPVIDADKCVVNATFKSAVAASGQGPIIMGGAIAGQGVARGRLITR